MIDPPRLMYYLVIWTVFGIIHSFLATEWIKNKINISTKLYRIFYNIVTSITFLLAVWLMPSPLVVIGLWEMANLTQKIIAISLGSLGVVILLFGLSAWNIAGFLGLEEEDDDLYTSGSFAFARHPVYTGVILILLSIPFIGLNTTTLGWLIGVGGYFILGTIPEEAKLQSIYGQQYRQYQKNVGRFFPVTLRNWRYFIVNLIN